MAGVAGFEPTPTALDTATLVLKTSVLPLHYTPKQKYLYGGDNQLKPLLLHMCQKNQSQ